MGKLTMRSKIRIYWTTNPADMGYDGRPTLGKMGAWKGPNAQYTLCSMRAALRFADELDKKVGSGTNKMISYQHDGQEITRSDINDIVACADWIKTH